MTTFRKVQKPRTIAAFLIWACLLFFPLPSYAETKFLLTEATYSMGDGETPSFAEAMALQKAKQMALEQAGTYVESYTKVQNYALTAEEIHTIAGGILEVEVLEKTRTLAGNGLRFYTKIKATVTTDKMQDLAQRVKGKNVAEEYKRLQEEYSKLSQEIEKWKQMVAKAPSGPEREVALDQIREREKAFAIVQKSEAAFFQRLVSGEALFSKALGQLSKKQNEKAVVDGLFQKILEQGVVITLGEPDIHATLKDPNTAEISVPVTLKADEVIKMTVEEIVRSLGGPKVSVTKKGFGSTWSGLALRMGNDPETVTQFQQRIGSLAVVMDLILTEGAIESCSVAPDYGMEGISGYLGKFPISPISLMLGDRILMLGLSHSLDSGRSNLKDNDGFVVIVDGPISFTAKTTIGLERAKLLRTIKGKMVEGTSDGFSHMGAQGLSKCKIAEEKSQ